MSPHSLADALAELAKIAKEKPSLKISCAVLADILPALFAEPIEERPAMLDSASAREKLTGGSPLLRGETIAFDAKTLQRRWLAVCRAAERQNDGARAVAEAFDQLNPSALLAEVLAGRPQAVPARASALQLDAGLTATVLRLAVFPVLSKYAAALEPLYSEAGWDLGICPVCGSWPLLGEFRGLEQIRFLRCAMCACEWRFSRLRCPFCANQDHHKLGYFHIEGEEVRYRAATCDECRGYVKMLSTLSALSPPALLAADLATLHLDLAAADRGYVV